MLHNRILLPALLPAGMCWCDAHCAAAGDCCPTCRHCRKQKAAANSRRSGYKQTSVGIASVSTVQPMIRDSNPVLAAQLRAEVASTVASGVHIHDCGAVKPLPRNMKSFDDVFSIASADPARGLSLIQAEERMLACQAADQGPPEEPTIIQIHWTAGKVCKGRRGARCVGGEYPASLVQQQIDYVNHLYAHVGIQFSWDGVIHEATAASAKDINVCLDPDGQCWACGLKRYGDKVSINVVTSPVHIG
jgi:hypothetical protein